MTSLLRPQQCNMYQLQSSAVTAFANWGSPLMKGSVEVVQVTAGKLQVKLLGEEGGVFGICALDQGSPSQNCRSASDSPSAFIIRIDQGGDAAHLGIQFVERTAAIAFSGLTSLTRATPTGSPVEPTVRRQARPSGHSSKMQLNLEGKVRTVSGSAVFARSSDEVEDAVRVTLSSPPLPSGVQRRFAAGTGPKPLVTSTPIPDVQPDEVAAPEPIAPPTVVSPPKPTVDLDDIFNSPVKQPPQQHTAGAEWDAPQPSTKPKDAFDDFFN